jgi:hypothetical protein
MWRAKAYSTRDNRRVLSKHQREYRKTFGLNVPEDRVVLSIDFKWTNKNDPPLHLHWECPYTTNNTLTPKLKHV